MSRNPQNKYLVETTAPPIEMPVNAMLATGRYKYMLVNVLARRARDLNRGTRATVDTPVPHTPTELALAEGQSDKLRIVEKPKSKVLVSLIKND